MQTGQLRKTCDRFNGNGRINVRETTYCHPGDPIETFMISDPCPDCNGKGYLERKEIWV